LGNHSSQDFSANSTKPKMQKMEKCRAFNGLCQINGTVLTVGGDREGGFARKKFNEIRFLMGIV
jgi:hypothetical protein